MQLLAPSVNCCCFFFGMLFPLEEAAVCFANQFCSFPFFSLTVTCKCSFTVLPSFVVLHLEGRRENEAFKAIAFQINHVISIRHLACKSLDFSSTSNVPLQNYDLFELRACKEFLGKGWGKENMGHLSPFLDYSSSFLI